MGVEERWRERFPPRRGRQWWDRGRLSRGRDDGTSAARRRSALLLIAGAGLAGLALAMAQFLPGAHGSGAARPAIAATPAVVAAVDIGFGERLTLDKLMLIDVPQQGLPAGHFPRLEPLLAGAGRTALRPIAAREILIETALVGGATRLSTAPLLGPAMRALAVQVTEVSGVSGLVFPGDRVDVLMTRQPEDAMPHAELLAQHLRVLAVGNDMNIARDQPGVVRSVTLEVSPLQAEKLTLAMASSTLSLALRPFSNNGRIRLESLQVRDLTDGTATRLLRKRERVPAGAAPGPQAAGAAAPAATAPGMIVVRGGHASAAAISPEPG